MIDTAPNDGRIGEIDNDNLFPVDGIMIHFLYAELPIK